MNCFTPICISLDNISFSSGDDDNLIDFFLVDSEEWRDIRGRNYEDYEEKFEMKSEDMQSSLHKTRLNLGKVKHFQFMGGADMSRVSHNIIKLMRQL